MTELDEKSAQQRLFNTAWDWFVVKNQPRSIDEHDTRCLYHGPNGERCAVGLFIPDDRYDPAFETAAYDLCMVYDTGLPLDTQEAGEDFFDALQHAHDQRRDVPMSERLREVAKEFNLTIPETTE